MRGFGGWKGWDDASGFRAGCWDRDSARHCCHLSPPPPSFSLPLSLALSFSLSLSPSQDSMDVVFLMSEVFAGQVSRFLTRFRSHKTFNHSTISVDLCSNFRILQPRASFAVSDWPRKSYFTEVKNKCFTETCGGSEAGS